MKNRNSIYRIGLVLGGLFFLGSSTLSYGQEKAETTQVIEEVVITTTAQNLDGKVWDMGPYYFCKFTKEDERQAAINGYLMLDSSRIDELRSRASREHNIAEKDIALISGRDTKEYGSYDICVGNTKYTYIRKGKAYNHYKKVK